MQLRRRITSTLVLASALGLLPALHADASERLTPAVSPQTQRQQIVDGINAERAAHGLPVLTYRQDAEQLSQATADELLANPAVFEHSDHWSTDLWRTTGCYGGPEVLAGSGNTTESLARADDGLQAVRQWIASPEHHEVLLSTKRTAVSVGVAYDSYIQDGMTFYETYWVANLVGDCPPPKTTLTPAPSPTDPPRYNPGPTEGWVQPTPAPPVVTPSPAPKPIKVVRTHRKRR